MPIYEYLCHDCVYKFELKQSVKDLPIATCAKCGKSVSRIISPPAIMFKGSGWYITDYSDKMKPPTGETADSSAATKKDTPATTSTASAATASVPSAAPSVGTSSGAPSSTN